MSDTEVARLKPRPACKAALLKNNLVIANEYLFLNISNRIRRKRDSNTYTLCGPYEARIPKIRMDRKSSADSLALDMLKSQDKFFFVEISAARSEQGCVRTYIFTNKISKMLRTGTVLSNMTGRRPARLRQ